MYRKMIELLEIIKLKIMSENLKDIPANKVMIL